MSNFITEITPETFVSRQASVVVHHDLNTEDLANVVVWQRQNEDKPGPKWAMVTVDTGIANENEVLLRFAYNDHVRQQTYKVVITPA